MYYKIRPGITLLIGLMTLVTIARAQVAINTTGDAAHASAMLEVSSNNKGILIPRMTTAERTAIANPASGLLVFDTTTNSFWYYHGTAAEWQHVGTSVAGASELDELSDVIHDGFNLFMGENAGINNDGENYNLAIGNSSLRDNVYGTYNLGVGNGTLGTNTSGYNNTALGNWALVQNTTGGNNIAIGFYASQLNGEGNNNVVLGSYANIENQNGYNNTIVGTEAGGINSYHTKSGNVFLGFKAGYNEIGNNKLYIENSNSSIPLIGGDFENDSLFFNGVVRITGGNPGANKVLTSDANGNATWEENDGGATSIDELSDAIHYESSLFIGNGAGEVADGGFNTGIGNNALNSNTSGGRNTGVGKDALRDNTTGGNNTVIGSLAAQYNTTGSSNIAIGQETLSYNTTADYNIAIGNSASFFSTTGEENISIGDRALMYNQTGSRNTVIGFRAGFGRIGYSKTGSVFIGYYAGCNEDGDNKLYIENSDSPNPLIGGDFANDSLFFNGVVRITGGNPGNNKVLTSDEHGNATWETINSVSELNDLSDAIYDGSSLFLGTNAGINSNAALLNVGIGKYALENNTGGFMNTSTGVYSQRANTNGNNNTSYGHAALKSNSTGNYNTAVGSIALQNNLANENTAVGYAALSTNTNGTNNVALGGNALKSNINGHYNTAVGFDALQANVSSLYNASFGGRSLFNNLGERNTASGYYSMYNNVTGNYNTAIGYRTMYSNTSGSNNTALGYNCGPSGANFSNTTAVGNEATPTASNMVRIGNASVTSIGGYAAWTNVSDQRFKSNIREDVSGLDFILKLRPVTYNLDVQQLSSFLGVESQSTDQKAMSEKSAIRQSGFIAQEVEEVAQQLGYDFSGIDAPKNGNDHYGLRYAEFVVPLVKAVQELAAENEALKKRIEVLEGIDN